jgi:glycolate oxidase FAD binding subunit
VPFNKIRWEPYMLDYDRLCSALAAAVGAENVTRVGAEVAALAVDGVVPRVVVSPGSVAEVQFVVRAAADQGASMIPHGGGSKMGLGSPPTSADFLLSLRRLDSVVEYDVANLTVFCQAGVRLETLQEKVLANRQFLPLDPPFTSRATVGGVVATNSSGPRRLAYGSVRDLVLGMKVVSSAGELLSVGGKTVKNVAGYDLDKPFIGSLGTLGIIVEVVFRLLPLPQRRATLLAAFPALPVALEMAGRLRESQFLPSALEVLNPRSLEACGLGKGTHCLLVALEGVPEAVERQKAEITALCAQHGSPAVEVLEGDPQTIAWREIRDLALTLASRSAGVVSTKSSVRPSDLQGVCEAARQAAERRGLPLCLDVRAGNGIVYVWLEGQAGDESRQVEAVEEMRAAAVAAGGSLVVESAPRLVKSAISVWGEPGSDLPAMRAVKAKLDPSGLLNPGRYVGGI